MVMSHTGAELCRMEATTGLPLLTVADCFTTQLSPSVVPSSRLPFARESMAEGGHGGVKTLFCNRQQGCDLQGSEVRHCGDAGINIELPLFKRYYFACAFV